jgi:hypothetical protein
MLVFALLILFLLVLAKVWCSKPTKREENGYDRTARREKDWYPRI